MDKPKRKLKPKSSIGRLSFLVYQSIDFTSPLSLDECVERLKAQERGSWLWGRRTEVSITSRDDAYCQFRFHQSRNSGMNMEAIGQMTRWEGTATRIEGQASPAQTTYFMFVVALIAGLAIFVLPTFETSGLFGVLPVLVIMALNWLILMYRRTAMVREIEQSLDPRKHKKS